MMISEMSSGHGWIQLIRSRGSARYMRMYQLHRVFRFKRNVAREHFIKCYSQRIQVSAVINAPVHSAGLLRGYIRECALYYFGIVQFVIRMRQYSRDTEIGYLYNPFFINQDIIRLDVKMDDVVLMNNAESF